MSESRSARSLAVEAAVIVGSILLAFAVDAWWQDRREAREEAELLVRLEEEFDLSETILLPRSGETSARTFAAIDLLGVHLHGVRELPADSLAWALTELPRSYQFAVASPVFDLLWQRVRPDRGPGPGRGPLRDGLLPGPLRPPPRPL